MAVKRDSNATTKSTISLVPSQHEVIDARRISISHPVTAPRLINVSSQLHVPKRRSSTFGLSHKPSSNLRSGDAKLSRVAARGEHGSQPGSRTCSAPTLVNQSSEPEETHSLVRRSRREGGIFRGAAKGERFTFEDLWRRENTKAVEASSASSSSPLISNIKRQRRETWIRKRALVQGYIDGLQNPSRDAETQASTEHSLPRKRYETEISDQGFTLIRRRSRVVRPRLNRPSVERAAESAYLDGATSATGIANLTPRRSSIFSRMLTTLSTLGQVPSDGALSRVSRDGIPPTEKSKLSASHARSLSEAHSAVSAGSGRTEASQLNSLTDTIAAFPKPPTSATSITQRSKSAANPDFGSNWEPENDKLYAQIQIKPGLHRLNHGETAEIWVAVDVRTKVYRPPDYVRAESRQGIDLALVVDLSNQTSSTSRFNVIHLIRYIYQSLRKEDRLAVSVLSSFSDDPKGEPDELRLGIGLQPISSWKIEALIERLQSWTMTQEIEEIDLARALRVAIKVFTDPEVVKVPRHEEGRYLFSKHMVVITSSPSLSLDLPVRHLNEIQLHHIDPSCVAKVEGLQHPFVWSINPFSTESQLKEEGGMDFEAVDDMLLGLRSDQNLGQLEQIDISVRPGPSCHVVATLGPTIDQTLRPGESLRLMVKARVGSSTASRSTSNGDFDKLQWHDMSSHLIAELSAMLGESISDILTVEAEYSHGLLPPATRLLTRSTATIKRALRSSERSHLHDSPGAPFTSLTDQSRTPSMSSVREGHCTGTHISPTTIRYARTISEDEQALVGNRMNTYQQKSPSSTSFSRTNDSPRARVATGSSTVDEDVLGQLASYLAASLQPRQALCAIDELIEHPARSAEFSQGLDKVRAELLHRMAVQRRLGPRASPGIYLTRAGSEEIINSLGSSPSSLLYSAHQQDRIDNLTSPTREWSRHHDPGLMPKPLITPVSQQRVYKPQGNRISILEDCDAAGMIWKRMEVEAGGTMMQDSPRSPFSSAKGRARSVTINEFVKELGEERRAGEEQENEGRHPAKGGSLRNLRSLDGEALGPVAAASVLSNAPYPYSTANQVVNTPCM